MLHNTLEGGTTGTNVSVANSGGASGDAFHQIVINNSPVNGGGAAIQYRAASAVRGSMGVRIIPQTSPSYLRWDVSESGGRFVAQAAFRYATAPATAVTLLWIHSAGGTLAGLSLRDTGRISVNNGTTNIVASQSPVLTPGDYLLRLAITPGTGTGVLEIQVLDASDESVVHTWTGSALTTLAGPASQYRFFVVSTASGWATVDGDDMWGGALASGWPVTPAEPLATPVLELVDLTHVTTIGGSDGSATISWPPVDGAHHYELSFMNGTVTTGFVVTDSAAVSPETFASLPPGDYTVTVKACVA